MILSNGGEGCAVDTIAHRQNYEWAAGCGRFAPLHRHAGLTLLELLVAVALMALILGIGAPSFREFQRNSRLTSVANDLLGAVQLARTEAVKRQKPISLCPSADVAGATPSCTSQADFSGWIVFEDPDGSCRPAADAAPIRVGAEIGADEATQLSARASGNCLSFAETGYVRDLAGFTRVSQLLVCDQRGVAAPGATDALARGLTVSQTGRASVTRDAATLQTWSVPCPPAGP
jgi:type IV fimbrial biogenesis protein FimT